MRETKFKVGDTVICNNRKLKGAKSLTRGVGWSKNRNFTIHRIDNSSDLPTPCYFARSGSGVYEDFLDLIKLEIL